MGWTRSGWLPGAVLAAAAASWFVGLDQPPLWTDEALTIGYSDSWSGVTGDFHPPLSYAAFRLWRLALPDGVGWLRLLSVLSTLAGVGVWALMWRRRAGRGEIPPAAAGIAVALALFSPHLVLYGRMVRYFGLATLGVALAVGASTWAWNRPRTATAAVAAMAAAALGTVNYLSALATGVALTAFLLLRGRSLLVRHAAIWGAGAALAGLVVAASDLADAPPAEVGSLSRIGLAAGFPLWSATVGETVNVLDLAFVLPAVAAWLVLGVVVVRALPKAPDVVVLSALLVVGGVAAAVLGGSVIGLEHTAVQSPKLFAAFAPALYLLAGWGTAVLAQRRRRALTVGVLAGIGLAWAPGLVHVRTGDDFLYPSYALPWDDVVDAVEAIAGPPGAERSSLAVVSADAAASVALADAGVAADVYEIQPAGSRLVHRGARRPADYDVVAVVERDRVNEVLDDGLTAASRDLLGAGYEVGRSLVLGRVDPDLRRLQERLAGRDLDDYLVAVVVYERTAER